MNTELEIKRILEIQAEQRKSRYWIKMTIIVNLTLTVLNLMQTLLGYLRK